MLIHVVPAFYVPAPLAPLRARLLSVAIPELGWGRAGTALRTGRPYPNKHYWVGSAAGRGAAPVGLLVETRTPIARYTVITQWGDDGVVTATHTVAHTVLDSEHEAVSDLAVLWYGEQGGFESRYPALYAGQAPMAIQPVMDLLPVALGGVERGGDVRDVIGPNGFIVERHERFAVPTIERARLAPPFFAVVEGPPPSIVDQAEGG